MTNPPTASTLVVDIHREEARIRVGIRKSPGLGSETLLPYEEKRLDGGELERVSREIFQVMNGFNEDGRLAEHSLRELKRLGGLLLDAVFPPGIKAELVSSRADRMVLRIDSSLVHVPWELLYDGADFFCLRWEMGRVVRTPQKLYQTSPRPLVSPLRMLLVADPRGDLPAAYQEGIRVRDLLDRSTEKVEVELLCLSVGPEAVRHRLKDCDLLHYAGHADYVAEEPSLSGWLVKGGKFSAGDVLGMAGGQGVPSLVFVNACRSGQTAEWSIPRARNREIFGLANAFLLAGAGHYIGTFWEIQDDPSSRFSLCFYERLMNGATVGRALKEARQETIRAFGERAIVWATYMLYGDPAFVYVEEKAGARLPGIGAGAVRPREAEAPRFRGETEPAARPPLSSGGSRRNRALLWIGAVLLILLAVYGVGQFQKLRQIQRIDGLLERTESDFPGNDRADELKGLYRQALSSPHATRGQQVNLHGRLAGVLAAGGDLEGAVPHYEKALEGDPENRDLLGGLCSALQRLGRHRESGECFAAMLNRGGDDRTALSARQGLEALLAENQERWKAERTDDLLDQLTAMREKAGPELSAGPEEEWTSRPLTLAVLEIEDVSGTPDADTGTELFHQGVLNGLRESPRVRIVDREALEKVLRELKVGAGGLADDLYALKLGRLLPARILVQGSLHRLPSGMQVHLRFIETETTTLTGAVSHTFSGDLSPEAAGGQAAGLVLRELSRNYPLQGRIVSVDGSGGVVMNLGRRLGVAQGSEFYVLPAGSTERRFSFARARVLAAKEDRATAVLVESGGAVSPGCRVIESFEQEP